MNCKICSSTKLKDLYFIEDLKHKVTDKKFLVSKCLKCEVLSITEDGNTISDLYYPDDYNAFSDEMTVADELMETFPLNVVKGRLAWTKKLRLSNNTQILDIGCGCGTHMAIIRKKFNSQISGIEPNRIAVNAAEKKGFRIHFGTLDNFQSSSKFDIIYLSHVIEHVLDPYNTLSSTYKLINPGGSIIIATPNINSLERFLFKKYWDGWDTPRHLFLFNSKSLKKLLEEIGFKEVKVYYEIYSLFNRSLNNMIKRKNNKIINFASRCINLILSYSLPFFHNSGAMQIIAKK